MSLYSVGCPTQGTCTITERVCGARNAKELENFLWDMEQFFKVAHVPDDEKVSITSMYLFGDAKLWWRTQMGDDSEPGRPSTTT